MRIFLVLIIGLMEVSAPWASELQVNFRVPLSSNGAFEFLESDFEEPSGIVYHPRRRTLFVVSDEGYLAEFALDGEIIRKKYIADEDLEGITVNPETGFLYVAVEGEEKILEVHPQRFKVRRTFSIERTYEGRMIFPEGGNGIESITFVPRKNHGEGGTFFVANQVEEPDGKERSYIAEVELALVSRSDLRGRIKRTFLTNIYDISGMQYIHAKKAIAVISDFQNLYAEMTLDGKILRELSLPGYDQEGITFDGAGNIYFTSDGGGEGYDTVFKIRALK